MSSKTPELLHAVTVHTSSDTGYVLEELFPSVELFTSSYFDRDDNIARLSIYFENLEEARATQALILEHLEQWKEDFELGPCEVVLEEVKKQDWSESWKAFFQVSKVSDRLVIKPSWEKYEAKPGEVIIEIDPGMSFGTGNHGTTKACLQFIDSGRTDAPQSFLDIGTGSGILSIAAAKLGCSPVDAFDYDEDSVRCAKENLELAKVDQVVNAFHQDLAVYQAQHTYDLVVANILATVLIEFADIIVTTVTRAPASRLIVSGILTDQYPAVLKAFEARGFVEVEQRTIAEWTSGILKFA